MAALNCSITTRQAREDRAIYRAMGLLEKRLRKPGEAFNAPRSVRDFLTLNLAGYDHEVFSVLWLDTGELIRAALEIPLAYIAAGSPAIDGLHPLGGFELWDKMVRRPLVWLGMADPLKAAEGLRQQDPDLEAMRMLFESWLAAFPKGEATAAAWLTGCAPTATALLMA